MGERAENRELGNGWKTALIAGLWALLMAVVGWDVTAAQTAREKMSADIASSQQRIAVLEEANRNNQESLRRIERLLDDINAKLEAQRSRR